MAISDDYTCSVTAEDDNTENGDFRRDDDNDDSVNDGDDYVKASDDNVNKGNGGSVMKLKLKMAMITKMLIMLMVVMTFYDN